jgi:hypothetical protein
MKQFKVIELMLDVLPDSYADGLNLGYGACDAGGKSEICKTKDKTVNPCTPPTKPGCTPPTKPLPTKPPDPNVYGLQSAAQAEAADLLALKAQLRDTLGHMDAR